MLILFSTPAKVIGLLSSSVKYVLTDNKSFSEAVLKEKQK